MTFASPRSFRCSRRLAAFASLLALLLAAAAPAQAQLDPEDLTLEAPDGNVVTIDRDDFGVPHVRSASEAALFYGQGYAVAQDRFFQLEQFRRAATGRLSEAGLPGTTFEADRGTRNVFYTEAERQRQFNRLGPELQTAYTNYVAGINRYVDSVQTNPTEYQPLEFALFSIPVEPWDVTESIAVSQFLIRRFGGSGGDELDRCEDLRALGFDAFDAQFPINDPDAPNTILDNDDPEPPGYPDSYPVTGLDQCPSEGAEAQAADREIIIDFGGGYTSEIPSTLGSFATLINQQKSASGEVMLLGAPQLQAQIQRNSPLENNASTAMEIELEAPGIHVGGLGLAGIPGVILGRNEFHAWSLTTGRSDNQDTFIYTLETSQSLDENRYLYEGEWRDFNARQEQIGDTTVTLYRTVHGPVVGSDLDAQEAYARAYTYWKEELDMAEAFNLVWRADDLNEVESAVEEIPVNFNFFYANRDQQIHYWHVGRFPDRGATGIDPRLPHLGDGSQDWEGFVPLADDNSFGLAPGQSRADFYDFDDLPQAQGTEVSQDFFVNWNNKPVEWWDQGDNVPWVGDQRVDSLYMYVPNINPFSYEDLKGVPDAIDDFGTYQQATRFGETLLDDLEQNTVPPGQSDFVSLDAETGPHYNDQWDQLRETDSDFLGEEPEDFTFKNMVFRRGVHAFSGTAAYRFEQFGVAVEPLADASGLTLLVRRAADPTEGAPETGSLPAMDPELAVEGSWTLVAAEAAPAGFSADVCFDLSPLTAPREDIAFEGLQVYRRAAQNAPWNAVTTSLRNDADGEPQQICANGISSFGEFAVGAAPSELPVELDRFEAEREGEDAVRVTWRTFSEENNDRFEVERRPDGRGEWAPVGTRATQAPAGTSTEAHAYQLLDESIPPTADRLVYRLRQIDRDGTPRIIAETEVEVGAPLSFALEAPYPNPFRQGDRVTIRYALPEAAPVRLVLFDARGRRIRTLVNAEQSADYHEVHLSAGSLASGAYFLRLKAGERMTSQSIVLLR